MPREGRVPVPVGCPGDAGTQRDLAPVGVRAVAAVDPSADSQAGRGRAGRRRAGGEGAMSQRQVLQGRSGRPDGGRRGPGAAGSALQRVSPRSVRAVPESPDPIRADGGGAGDQTAEHRDAAKRG